jgi:hypothetical protein
VCRIYLYGKVARATGPTFSGAPHIILTSCVAGEFDISRSNNVIAYMSEALHL